MISSLSLKCDGNVTYFHSFLFEKKRKIDFYSTRIWWVETLELRSKKLSASFERWRFIGAVFASEKLAASLRFA